MSEKEKHTKGPWRVSEHLTAGGEPEIIVMGERLFDTAFIVTITNPTNEDRANAALIASAPTQAARIAELTTFFETECAGNQLLQARIEELETQLNAWFEIFGTTQLSHAAEKYRVLTAQVERLRGELSTAYMNIGTMMGKTEEPQSIRMMGEIAQESIQDALAETGTTEPKQPWEGTADKGAHGPFLFCSEKCANDFGSDCCIERGLHKFGAEPLSDTIANTWGEGATCENCGEEVFDKPGTGKEGE